MHEYSRNQCVWMTILAGLLLFSVGAQGQGLSLDDELALLAEEIPGFGGMFYDEEGVLNVYLTDTRQAGTFTKSGEDVRILQGRYDFLELRGWRDQAHALMNLPGVVFLDIDEMSNRVKIGFDPGSGARAIGLSKRLAKLGIPSEAVVFTETTPIYELSHDLTHSFNPVPGGVEINFSNFLCTLGFNVRREDSDACFFVTNDHCTDVQGAVTGTVYFQPFGGPQIGVEILDPPFFTGGACPAGRQCRFSDAALARYNGALSCEFAKIARTVALGSTVINAAQPRWMIVSKQGSPVAGQTMHKVGRTTGWTQGTVVQTCATTNVAGSNITRLCQGIVSNFVGGPPGVLGGDSGSPVFRARLDSSLAQLSGILWGGDGPGTLFVFSPMNGIETDFGFALPVF